MKQSIEYADVIRLQTQLTKINRMDLSKVNITIGGVPLAEVVGGEELAKKFIAEFKDTGLANKDFFLCRMFQPYCPGCKAPLDET